MDRRRRAGGRRVAAGGGRPRRPRASGTRLKNAAADAGRGAAERILAAAVGLLEEAGYEGFNTNAIAVRAGVNVATVYRHFPDKFAVVRALAMRLESERVERAVGLIDGLGTAADWRDTIARIVTAVMFARRTQPGALAVRRALQASPSLQDIERDATARLVEALATALLRRRPSLGQPRARVLSTSVVVAAGALLDHAWDRPDPDDALVEEAAAMAIRYLAPDLS